MASGTVTLSTLTRVSGGAAGINSLQQLSFTSALSISMVARIELVLLSTTISDYVIALSAISNPQFIQMMATDVTRINLGGIGGVSGVSAASAGIQTTLYVAMASGGLGVSAVHLAYSGLTSATVVLTMAQ